MSIRSDFYDLPKNCRVLAVSKLQSIEKIRALYDQGQRLFAENYVQEALAKQQELLDLNIEWHFIGRLQKNKIKQLIGKFELIHSIDSVSLAEAFNKRLADSDIKQKILLQINLAKEESKAGFDVADLDKVLSVISKMKNLEVCGFMTMPPHFENPELTRPYFQKLRGLRDRYQKLNPKLTELSMGTSSDFRVAAQEGATVVRLGTLLFGERSK